MRILSLALIGVFLSGLPVAQKRRNPSSTLETPLDPALWVRRNDSPRVSLGRALKLAQSYMRRHKISTSGYHLVQAMYTSTDIESNRIPCWRFLWVKAKSQPFEGGDLEALVFMNGLVS